jgi:D-glycero-D-manno-heptose 1,7-bisphosphate phosphatase
MIKALFLDRDGVINHDDGYTYEQENFRFIDGIFELGRAAVKKNYQIFVVTNQAGIGRGYYTESQFLKLTDWMLAKFNDEGVPISDVFYCPDHPIYGIGQYKKESFDRKPNPGMILKAIQRHKISSQVSIMIGDKDSDMEAAFRANVSTRCLIQRSPVVKKITGFETCVHTELIECVNLLC